MIYAAYDQKAVTTTVQLILGEARNRTAIHIKSNSTGTLYLSNKGNVGALTGYPLVQNAELVLNQSDGHDTINGIYAVASTGTIQVGIIEHLTQSTAP